MGKQTNPPLTPSQVRDFAAEKTRHAGEAIERTWENVLPRIEQFCRERPLTAIAIGVVAGMAIRSLLSRSHAMH